MMRVPEYRRLRHQLGLSQAALARVLGVSRLSVARWETRVIPIPPMAERLLRALAEAYAATGGLPDWSRPPTRPRS
jgi:DNA-binding transcriptional regulator YiaG